MEIIIILTVFAAIGFMLDSFRGAALGLVLGPFGLIIAAILVSKET